MSTQELLQPFCAVDDIRVSLNRIFKKGDYLYATNGHVIVSVKDDGTETCPDNDALAPNGEVILQREKCAGPGFVPLRFDEPQDKEKCTSCGGSGKIAEREICDSCNGNGSFEHYDHWYECQACDGEGTVKAKTGETDQCEDCNGSGESKHQPVTLPDGRTFKLLYLNKLLALPGIEYLPDPMRDDGTISIMQFRFDGGIGALMPIRV